MSRKIALSVELTDDTAAVQVIAARRTPAGVELQPQALPNHLMTAAEVCALFFQFVQAGMIQQARVLPDSTKVWGPVAGEYRVTPTVAKAEGNGKAGSRLILPGEG